MLKIDVMYDEQGMYAHVDEVVHSPGSLEYCSLLRIGVCERYFEKELTRLGKTA